MGIVKKSTFEPFPLLKNPHLQTLWASKIRKTTKIENEKWERIELPDGDFLDTVWTKNVAEPTVAILHGLEGNYNTSPYIKSLMAKLEARGIQAILIHFRGCGRELNRLQRSYHAGDTNDIQFAIQHIKNKKPSAPLAIIGYSLGGNVCLKWLGEKRPTSIKTAVAISVPFDLSACASKLNRGISKCYQRYLLKSMQTKFNQKVKKFGSFLPIKNSCVLNTFREFDDMITAPLHGFSGATEYYKESSCLSYLPSINTTTLIIHSLDDPFLPLGIAAVNTQKLELSTGIAIAFSRSPMVVANIGWDLQAASGGRFVLGLGSQVKGHNERRFSVQWSPPAPRLREYAHALRAIWNTWKTGEPLNFEGQHYRFTLMTPNFTPEPMDSPAPPITVAAVGPAMMKVAGQAYDGVRLHPFCTRRYLEDAVIPILENALVSVGRQRKNFEISGGGFIATGADDEAVAKMFEWVRMRIGFYGSTRAYWPVLEAHDLEELGLKLNHMSRNNKWDQMAQEVTDDIVHLFAAVGRHDEIAEAIRGRFGGISDAVYDSASSELRGGLPADAIQNIQSIPSTFTSFAN